MCEIRARIADVPERCARLTKNGGGPIKSELWYCNWVEKLIHFDCFGVNSCYPWWAWWAAMQAFVRLDLLAQHATSAYTSESKLRSEGLQLDLGVCLWLMYKLFILCRSTSACYFGL
jgi:hypothetical protein